MRIELSKKEKNPGSFKFWLTSLFCRYFNTLFLGLVVLSGVRQWWLAIGLIVAGYVLDRIRWKVSPDLQGGMSGLATFVQRSTANEKVLQTTLGFQKRIFLLIYLLSILYVLIVFALNSFLPPEQLKSYFLAVLPLTEMGELLFPIVRNQVAISEAQGLPYLALMAGHLYTVISLLLIFILIGSSFTFFYNLVLANQFAVLKKIAAGKMLNKKLTADFLNKDFHFFGLFLLLFIITILGYYTILGYFGYSSNSLAKIMNYNSDYFPLVLHIFQCSVCYFLFLVAYISGQFFRFDYSHQLLKRKNSELLQND